MDRGKSSRPDSGLKEEAVSWYLRVQEGITQSEFRAWRHWLAEDDVHAEAFDAVNAFWQEAEQLDDLPWPTDQELASDSYDGLVALPLPDVSIQNTVQRKIGRRGWLAVAASISAISVIGLILFQDSVLEHGNYQTAIAEHQVIPLKDGSSITLGADSNVTVDFDKHSRHIELGSGEAYFKVAKDQARPFIVVAGTRTIRALGTEFDVNIGVRDIKVAVVEGRVRVEGPATVNENSSPGLESVVVSNLKPGDVLDFNVAGDASVVSEVDPLLTASWLDRRLAYVGVPLESVIADVNRYSETELIIGDEATQQLIFTGTIFSDDIDNWLLGLEKVFPLRLVEVEGHGILLIKRNI